MIRAFPPSQTTTHDFRGTLMSAMFISSLVIRALLRPLLNANV
jgi:hypothetical protein